MVRSKVRYEYIPDERTRRETFKKRKAGLLKKLNELKTLCNIEGCGIIFNMEGNQTETWPSATEASQVIEKFISQPSSSHTNNRVNQVGFLRKSLSRISKNLDKETRKVHSLEKELSLAERVAKEEVNSANQLELQDMLRVLEKKIEAVESRLTEMAL